MNSHNGMNDDDLKLLQAHLARQGVKKVKCPVCGNKTWEAYGPLNLVGELPNKTDALVVTPHAELVCGRCFYTLSFAWMLVNPGYAKFNKLPDEPPPAAP